MIHVNSSVMYYHRDGVNGFFAVSGIPLCVCFLHTIVGDVQAVSMWIQ